MLECQALIGAASRQTHEKININKEPKMTKTAKEM
jgi:hypothetical protein